MTIWAIADLHLAIGVPSKSMDIFGPRWHDYEKKIRTNWLEVIKPEDLVLIAGDICWAMRLQEALPDMEWIHQLPGTKVMIRGNHDYWWDSPTKMRKVLPPSIHVIQNDVFNWGDVTIGGARMWDTPEYHFGQFGEKSGEGGGKGKPAPTAEEIEKDDKLFQRELQRLELSLEQLNKDAKVRIAMTHYPPISADLQPSLTSAILEKHRIDICVFGHLHNLQRGLDLFGEKNGVKYYLTACDYMEFRPLKLL